MLKHNDEICVNDICEIINLSLSSVSQHLRKLRDFGLITNRKSGTYTIYSIKLKYLDILNDTLQLFENIKSNTAISLQIEL